MRNFQNPRDFGRSWVPPKWTDFNAARLRRAVTSGRDFGSRTDIDRLLIKYVSSRAIT
jgi:hypothetical protein